MRAGDLLKAGEQFERCIRLDPNYAPGWLALAESEYRMGNVARSRTTLDRLLARAPMYSQALLLKARVHGDLNQPREMKSALDLAVIAGAPAREVAVERARLLISAGDTEAAIRLLRATAVSSGHEPSVSIALASAEAALGRRDLALAALDASAASHPAATEIAFAKGTFLLQFGEHQQALSIFSDLAAQTPASPALAARTADSLALSGRLREAAAEYERAMRLPGAAPHVWVSAGAVYSAIGDADSARRCYQQALARDGSNPIALNNLAYLLGRSGQQLDYALQLAQNAGAVLPDSDEVQDTLIYLSLRMGLKQQALGILERAASRSTSSSKAWFKSLRAQLSKGTAEEVLRRLEEAQRTRKLT
jgi:tetratricopeptide (TPR) repeat protein